MDPINIASIVMALIAMVGSLAVARTTSRADFEKEAYIRARKMDVETIDRQDKEIAELKGEIKDLKRDVRDLTDRLNRTENKTHLVRLVDSIPQEEKDDGPQD